MGRTGRFPRRLVCEGDLSQAGPRLDPASEIVVNTLKQIYLALVQLAKQVWSFPQAITNANQRRKLQIVRNEREAERLDRIRNPSKYLGK